jgi:hypothetical protein
MEGESVVLESKAGAVENAIRVAVEVASRLLT